jgi:hypothetical protein
MQTRSRWAASQSRDAAPTVGGPHATRFFFTLGSCLLALGDAGPSSGTLQVVPNDAWCDDDGDRGDDRERHCEVGRGDPTGGSA